MPLLNLLEPLTGEVRAVHGEAGSAFITGIAYDSRKVRPGNLFVAVEGFTTDGHAHLPQALSAGAAAVVVRDVERVPSRPVPVVEVKDTRRALALLSASFFGFPGRELTMVGVTGTNGKTTTSILIESILKHAGKSPGLIGTMYARVAGETRDASNTTPESLDLQRLLAEMRDVGHDSVVMEVSSHGLALDRVLGCAFDVGVFTNLTQDHLDFHRTLEEYYRAKRLLFEGLGVDNPKKGPRGAVVNADDARARDLQRACTVPVLTYGIKNDADLRATEIEHRQGGTTLRVGERRLSLKLSGLFNVYNALAALGAAQALGIDADVACQALEAAPPVRGRFETVDAGQDFTVIVDYAHTPDGLENILRSARDITAGRLHVVFGCGGDRDATKRPLMGRLAADLADRVIVTSDNPRTEDPKAILGQVEAGVRAAGGSCQVIEDRREAIREALTSAGSGDTVVIAGKGHETYQILGARTVHFDDAEEARLALGLGGAR